MSSVGGGSAFYVRPQSVIRPKKFMKFAKRIESVIGLMDVGAPYDEIRSILETIHTDLEAYEQAQAQKIKLAKEKAARDARRN